MIKACCPSLIVTGSCVMNISWANLPRVLFIFLPIILFSLPFQSIYPSVYKSTHQSIYHLSILHGFIFSYFIIILYSKYKLYIFHLKLEVKIGCFIAYKDAASQMADWIQRKCRMNIKVGKKLKSGKINPGQLDIYWLDICYTQVLTIKFLSTSN